MVDYNLDKRKYVIGGVAIAIVVIYAIRLFTLQIMSEDYKMNADSNAFLKQIEFPSRGAIYDRNGKLMVYNSPSYDIMVVMKEQEGRLDTMDFCNSLGITKEAFEKRMETIKDRNKNPGYSRYTQQLFMTQLSDKDLSVFQEKMFRFPGFYVQKRSVREYVYPYAAHVLGDVGEVSPSDIEEDDYYQPGDYIGKQGIERQYEKDLRGRKGVQILLRDARGRIKGRYKNGQFDQTPLPGKDIQLGLDAELQKLGELESSLSSIVNDPAIPKSAKLAKAQEILAKTNNIEAAHLEIVKSADYQSMPTDEEKKEQDAADNDISDEITDSEKADNAELTDASENTQDKADNVTDDNNNQVSDIKNPDTMDTKASEKTYEKDNRKIEYSTEIKKVSRKLKKGFEAADMLVDIII